MGVVLGIVVGDARQPGVELGAPELLGGDLLAGGGFHQRRAAQEDGRLLADHDGLVRHRRHIGAAGGAGAHDASDLGNARRRHRRLIVEDAAEMLAVGEDLVLVRQVGAAGVDQVDAGKAVLQRDLLGPQMLLDGERVIGAALDGGVVDDDDRLAAFDAADAGDHAGGGDLAAIHVPGGELADLQKGRARIEKLGQPLAGQQLAAGKMPLPRLLGAAALDDGRLVGDVGDQRAHAGGFVRESG